MALNFQKVRDGLTLAQLASAPTSPVNGDIYYDAGLNMFMFYQNGAYTNISGKAGDVVGPASSTNNALARFNGTTGKLLQNSTVTLSGAGALAGITDLTLTGVTTLSSALTGVLKATSGVVSAGSIVNTDVSAAAAIALTKLASMSVNQATITDASGFIVVSPTTATEISYLQGVTSNVQTQLNSKRTRSIIPVSTATTLGATAGIDYAYIVTGTTTVTLPTAVGNTNRYSINNAGSNTVTVTTTSAQTMNGVTSLTMTPDMLLEFVSDGSNWRIF